MQVGVTLGKMGHIWPNGSNLGRWVTLDKHGSHLSKLAHLEVGVTLRKSHIWPNTWEGESHSTKWVTLIKIVTFGRTWEGESHLINMGHTYQKAHLEVRVTLRKMGHIWPNGSNLGRCHTLQNGSKLSHLEVGVTCAKWVTFGQMGQTWEGESHSIKWVTLIKIVALGSRSHTGQNGSHLAKLGRVKFGKVGRWVTLYKMGHTYQNCRTWK